jgi:hypothetical protein
MGDLAKEKMTRLASGICEADRPIYCSACFNSQPVRHVDFDAACDRGYGNEEATKISFDDLIICENCFIEGLQILGIEDSRDLKARVIKLSQRLQIEERLRKQAQNYADTMEEALQRRPEQVEIDHRKKPRQIREPA